MASYRAIFVSGLILGVGVGLLLGHLTLWRTDSATEELGEAISFGTPSEMPGTMPFLEPLERSASLPDEALGFDSADDEPHIPSPLANALAIELTEEALPTASRRPSAGIPPAHVSNGSSPIGDTNDVREAPQPLHIPAAEPLDTHHGSNESRIRELIERELADMPPAQRDIWFESLKDMRQEDVTGVLRMWKLFGGPPPGQSVDEIPELPVRRPSSPPSRSQPEASSSGKAELVEAARQIHLRNVRQANTLGYKRRVPRFVEAADGSPPGGVVSETVFDPGETISTGHRLDCCLAEPDLFFVVENGREERFYTRNGRFSIGVGRHLVLQLDGEEFIVRPGIDIPEDIDDITIEANGTVTVQTVDDEEGRPRGRIQTARVLSPHLLVSDSNGLFRAAGSVAEACVVSVEDSRMDELSPIASGRLEASNVDVDREWHWIEQLQRLMAE